jgi:ParB family chromosome partitioning protein
MELALVENIQRADLNPIEEAQAYRVLMELGAYTQDQLAQRVGKDRSTVSNAMRLLRLPEPVQDMVRDGRLSMGHARALLGLEHEEDIRSVAQEAFRSGWNVRATEQAVRQRTARAREQTRPSHPDDERHKIIVGELETRLRRKLGVRARLRTKGSGNKAGVLEIPYASLEELDRLLHIIMAEGV